MNSKNLRKRLGEKARELRKAAKMTQQEVADKLGVYREDISAFETRGEVIGSIERIEALFNLFGYELIPSEKKNYIDLRLEEEELKALLDILPEMPESKPKKTLIQRIKDALPEIPEWMKFENHVKFIEENIENDLEGSIERMTTSLKKAIQKKKKKPNGNE